MPNAGDVRPQRWSDVTVLFDDGDYSVISGVYEKNGEQAAKLGERWNGDDGERLGFPNVAGNPVWHVVPPFLDVPLLHGLLDQLARAPHAQQAAGTEERRRAILAALDDRLGRDRAPRR